jgi:hypothetical protein
LYFHAIRVPLSKRINCGVIVGGERESHEGTIKINQIGAALDAYTRFVEKFGIELFLPLRGMRSDENVKSIIGEYPEGESEQVECALSRNYVGMDGSVIYSESNVKRFYDEFAIEEAEDTLKRYLCSLKDSR